MNIFQRAAAPTPEFFKMLRRIGIAMVAVSGGLLLAPVALPTIIVTAAGYVSVIGTTIIGISQITVDFDVLCEIKKKSGHG